MNLISTFYEIVTFLLNNFILNQHWALQPTSIKAGINWIPKIAVDVLCQLIHSYNVTQHLRYITSVIIVHLFVEKPEPHWKGHQQVPAGYIMLMREPSSSLK